MPPRNVTVTLEGGEELRAKLAELGEAAKDALRDAVQAGGEIVLADARARAPGPHVEMEVVEAGADFVVIAIGPDDEHFYYMFFEFGAAPHTISPSAARVLAFPGREGDTFRPGVRHPGMGARPWLRPAIDSRSDEAVDAARDELRRAVLRVAD